MTQSKFPINSRKRCRHENRQEDVPCEQWSNAYRRRKDRRRFASPGRPERTVRKTDRTGSHLDCLSRVQRRSDKPQRLRHGSSERFGCQRCRHTPQCSQRGEEMGRGSSINSCANSTVVGLQAMDQTFPNRSRSYDEAGQHICFFGYDGSFEFLSTYRPKRSRRKSSQSEAKRTALPLLMQRATRFRTSRARPIPMAARQYSS